MSCDIDNILNNYKIFLNNKQIEYKIKPHEGDKIYDITLYFPDELKELTIKDLNDEYINSNVGEKFKNSNVGHNCDYLSFINKCTFNKPLRSTPINKLSRRKTIGSIRRKTIGSTRRKTI